MLNRHFHSSQRTRCRILPQASKPHGRATEEVHLTSGRTDRKTNQLNRSHPSHSQQHQRVRRWRRRNQHHLFAIPKKGVFHQREQVAAQKHQRHRGVVAQRYPIRGGTRRLHEPASGPAPQEWGRHALGIRSVTLLPMQLLDPNSDIPLRIRRLR